MFLNILWCSTSFHTCIECTWLFYECLAHTGTERLSRLIQHELITPKILSSQGATIKDIDESNPPIAPDHLRDVFEEAEPEGQRKQIQKESTYVRRLREGEGKIDARPSLSLLPVGLQKGLQEAVEGGTEVGDLAEEGDDDREMKDIMEEFAMATAIGGAEGLEPSFDEAQKCSDWPQWETTICTEIKSLNNNETWTVVKHPSGTNVIDSGWVLRIKKDAAGKIEKYKACLVAKGFTVLISMKCMHL